MQVLSASEARAKFGAFLDMAARGPVAVTRRGRVVGVLVGARHSDALRTFYAARLERTMAASAVEAEMAGLTADRLNNLLADES